MAKRVVRECEVTGREIPEKSAKGKLAIVFIDQNGKVRAFPEQAGVEFTGGETAQAGEQQGEGVGAATVKDPTAADGVALADVGADVLPAVREFLSSLGDKEAWAPRRKARSRVKKPAQQAAEDGKGAQQQA